MVSTQCRGERKNNSSWFSLQSACIGETSATYPHLHSGTTTNWMTDVLVIVLFLLIYQDINFFYSFSSPWNYIHKKVPAGLSSCFFFCFWVIISVYFTIFPAVHTGSLTCFYWRLDAQYEHHLRGPHDLEGFGLAAKKSYYPDPLSGIAAFL